METSTPPLSPPAGRGRGRLLLVAVLFAAPIVVALVLRAVGWEPAGLRNFGQLLDPPVALADTPARTPEGLPLDWTAGERGFNLLAQAPARCEADCAALYDSLHRVWLSQGRHADRVRVLWAGPLPDGAERYAGLQPVRVPAALAARLPARAPGAPAVDLVDGRGFLALHYPAGFDPSGLRKDLARLLK